MRIPTRLSVLALAIGGLLLMPAVSEAQFYAFFGKNPKIQYKSFDWNIYHSTHFDVYHYTTNPDELQRVVSFAESAYDYLSREFDYQIKQPTPLIFYRTHAEFQQTNVISSYRVSARSTIWAEIYQDLFCEDGSKRWGLTNQFERHL